MARMSDKLKETVAAHFVDDPREFVFFLEDLVRHEANTDLEFEQAWKGILRALSDVAEATAPLYRAVAPTRTKTWRPFTGTERKKGHSIGALRSQRATDKVEAEVKEAADIHFGTDKARPVYEHGHWWVIVDDPEEDREVIYDVVDTQQGFDFERVG